MTGRKADCLRVSGTGNCKHETWDGFRAEAVLFPEKYEMCRYFSHNSSERCGGPPKIQNSRSSGSARISEKPPLSVKIPEMRYFVIQVRIEIHSPEE